ncbi:nucleoside triphosphate pyrophosphohydrolase [Alicyclobacillus cellulosilyticus]|uniref:Nucleoside triphosphate pyrophosphohydrolase n=1 Tax=Alicyclobacillus cellulosilyticus TaxID=1003997 RepID=A0A917KCE4_9BACL|nr:nucleoside triphosphate pyrophosphohydrolase [Alicyclobacillus cellulosilyticus]GGJ08931.1 nucleoside triphosphate pyrophosphohydrolase [Alicyclobacillus cellulosilyticus]
MSDTQPIVHVVGLGPGHFDGLPVGSLRWLQSGLPVILRTVRHPVVERLAALGVRFTSFDALYETRASFEQLYADMAAALVAAAKAHGEVVYAVPGHPLMAERSVQILLAHQPEVAVDIGPGQSFLDAVCAALKLDPITGLVILDGTALAPEQLQVRQHLLIAQVFDRSVASEVKLTLMEVYPDEAEVDVVRAAGVPGLERIARVPLYELDRLDWVDHLTTVHVPPAEDERTLRRDPWTVVDVVRRLRAPDGCPWDRKQTHQSLRPFVIEEAYEVADAIDRDNPDALAGELGDLLLQVLLHAQIAAETGDFTIRDVWERLADKLIRRHPHVFGDKRAHTPEEVEGIWQSVKAAERAGSADDGPDARTDDLFADVRWGRPAFQVALALQRRAAELGLDWPDIAGVFAKVGEELAELRAVWDEAGTADARVAEELADLLFSAVNLARWLQLDPEAALAAGNRKFAQRVQAMAARAAAQGRRLGDLSAQELDELWSATKRHKKSASGRP